ncbi:MAG: imidazolonepropionase [Myxococcota bacterium]
MTSLHLTDLRIPSPDRPMSTVSAEILVRDGKIAAVNPEAQPDDVPVRSLGGRLVTPGLIDAHTHLVWSGSRSNEHAMRFAGQSYEAIARAGGGIRSTVRAVQEASDEALLRQTVARARQLAREGVTTLEIKSGYGLTVHDELRTLRVARQVAHHVPVNVVTTLLAAHAIPEGMTAEAWVDIATEELIPRAAHENLCDAVDVFCESIGFTVAQCERIWSCAQAHGLAIKGHTEQLSNLGGGVAAARHGALSVDHVEYLSAEDVPALAASGTIAMLLPLAFYALKETTLPPIESLRQAGVPIAIATDANPGSAPLISLRLAAHMGCTLMGLSPTEVWNGITCHAARALGLNDRGSLAPGSRADLAIWDAEGPADIVCSVGTPILHATLLAGVWNDA